MNTPRFEITARKLWLVALLLGVALVPISRLNVQLAILVVLFLTLLAIVWYTHETHLLRLQHIRPYVLLIRFGDTDYRLINVGNGTALNITVTEAETSKGKSDIPWDFIRKLAPGEESHPYIMATSLTSGYDPIFGAILNPDDFFEATVTYEDVEGTAYATRMLFKLEANKVLSRVRWSRRRKRW